MSLDVRCTSRHDLVWLILVLGPREGPLLSWLGCSSFRWQSNPTAMILSYCKDGSWSFCIVHANLDTGEPNVGQVVCKPISCWLLVLVVGVGYWRWLLCAKAITLHKRENCRSTFQHIASCLLKPTWWESISGKLTNGTSSWWQIIR